MTVSRSGETLSPVATPVRLVTDGPLAVVRSPMSLGVVVALAGVAVFAGSPAVAAYAGVLWLVSHAIVVLAEEPELREAFGRNYDRYCERVPRWLPDAGADRVVVGRHHAGRPRCVGEAMSIGRKR